MNTAEPVLVEVADRVAVITLNRPEARNALNRAVRKALPRPRSSAVTPTTTST